MRLHRVTGPRFRCTCMQCHRYLMAGDDCTTYADLDGPAYKAYYCAACTGALLEHEARRINAAIERSDDK